MPITRTQVVEYATRQYWNPLKEASFSERETVAYWAMLALGLPDGFPTSSRPRTWLARFLRRLALFVERR